MMIKNFIKLSLFALLMFFANSDVVQAQENSKIYLFYGQGCPHCVVVDEYFSTQDLYTQYPIEKKEIYSNRENALLFTQMLSDLNIPENQRGVPLVIIGNQVLVGDKSIIANFETEANNFLATAPEEITPETVNADKNEVLDLTLTAVIGASIVDAINPCAFAVLIILMSTILVAGNSKKALLTGLSFASSIFISYFLMGLGLYKALELGGVSKIFFKIVGWMAILLGILNLKDWLWYGKGVLMEVPLSWRPKLQKLLKSVTTPLGAFGIGFVVSLFLLPCTSGPYIVILGMLANKVSQFKAFLYLLLYNLIFILPMIIISVAVYKGFDPNKAEEIRQQRLKTLHLVAGLVMLLMGILIVRGYF